MEPANMTAQQRIVNQKRRRAGWHGSGKAAAVSVPSPTAPGGTAAAKPRP